MVAKALLGVLLASPLLGSGDVGADTRNVNVNFTEVPYRETRAFLDVHGELGPQPAGLADQEITSSFVGFGLGIMSARRTNIQLVFDLNYRRLDLEDLGVGTVDSWEYLVGGRLYPLKPTFSLGNMAVRVTASGSGGLLSSDGYFGLAMLATAGFALSFEDDPSGLKLEGMYRPFGGESEFYPDPDTADFQTVEYGASYGLRVSFLFGP